MTQAILLIDAVTQDLTPLHAALRAQGYAPTTVVDTSDPLKEFSSTAYELVFISMHCREAQSMCDGIRNKPEGTITPIIFLGDGKHGIASPAEALAAGGDYYFSLPLDLPRITAKVQTYVGSATSGADAPVAAKSASPSRAESVPVNDDGLDDDLMALAKPTPRPPAAAKPESAPKAAALDDDALLDELATSPGAPAKAPPRSAPEKTAPSPVAEDDFSDLDSLRTPTPMSVKGAFAPVTDTHPPAEALSDGADEAVAQTTLQGASVEPPVQHSPPPPAPQAQGSEDDDELDALAKPTRKALATAASRARDAAMASSPTSADPYQAAHDEPLDELEDLASLSAPHAEDVQTHQASKPPPPEARATLDLAEASDAVLAEITKREAELIREAERLKQEEARIAAAEAARLAAAAEAARQREFERQAAEAIVAREAEEKLAREKADAEEKVHQAVLEAEARTRAEAEAQREAEVKRKREADGSRTRAAAEHATRQKAANEVRRAEEEARRKAEEEALAATATFGARNPATRGRGAQTSGAPSTVAQQPTDAPPVVLGATIAAALPTAEIIHGPGATAPLPQAIESGVPTLGHKPLEPPTGTLSGNRDVATLLIDCNEQRITGRVDVTADQRQKTVFFENGAPVDAYSSQIYDRMEEYLLRHGKITRSQYQEVRAKRLRTARIGAHLVNEGFLKTEELFSAVRGQLEEMLYGLFEWEDATYSYRNEITGLTDRVFLDWDPRALVLEGVRRKYSMERLVKAVGSPASLVGLKDEAAQVVKVLHLTPDEIVALRLLDGQRTIEDLVFSSGLEAQRIYQLVYGLVLCNAAVVAARGLDPLTDDTRSDSIDKARILEKTEQVRFLDYFAILGLTREATPYEIERAFQEAADAFEATKFSDDVRLELRLQLAEIVEVLGDAKHVLGDPDRRDAYAKHLP